uniref:AlNc14C80G5251 protein n=1 Tax=Albugo laibachii Nc14 TaxID=890382 RepID=F0WF57_9STRA|nr:AlNc14C80G5251 [Albugo laibachii Nc14]|eukprot:CCA19839.1 AlNc14C80G5251 [Albugo laibachii Nc14]
MWGSTEGKDAAVTGNSALSSIRIIVHPPKSIKSHSMLAHQSSRESSEATDTERVRTFVATSRHLRKRVFPVIGDLQFYVAFRMMPIKSPFWFLQVIQPDIFSALSLPVVQWNRITISFSTANTQHNFGGSHYRPSWTHVACAVVPTIRSAWRYYAHILPDLWLALQAVTLHFVWTDRNRRFFDKRSATPTIPAFSVIYTTFSAHGRYF